MAEWGRRAALFVIVRPDQAVAVGRACGPEDDQAMGEGFAVDCDTVQYSFQVFQILKGNQTASTLLRLSPGLRAQPVAMLTESEDQRRRGLPDQRAEMVFDPTAGTRRIVVRPFTFSRTSCTESPAFYAQGRYLAFADADGEVFAAPAIFDGEEDVLLLAARAEFGVSRFPLRFIAVIALATVFVGGAVAVLKSCWTGKSG